ncbi:hypothetical protein Trydic_g13387 [Trypoxylus dichotomus]
MVSALGYSISATRISVNTVQSHNTWTAISSSVWQNLTTLSSVTIQYPVTKSTIILTDFLFLLSRSAVEVPNQTLHVLSVTWNILPPVLRSLILPVLGSFLGSLSADDPAQANSSTFALGRWSSRPDTQAKITFTANWPYSCSPTPIINSLVPSSVLLLLLDCLNK